MKASSGRGQDAGHAGRPARGAAAADCRIVLAVRRRAVRLLHSGHGDARACDWSSENPNPTREEIAHELRAHLCRCTGYVKIVDAIEELARVSRGEEPRGRPNAAAKSAHR